MIHGFMTGDEFEAVADAAMRAMFAVDGRIDPTPSAKYPDGDASGVVATRAFKARFRRELRMTSVRVWPKAKVRRG